MGVLSDVGIFSKAHHEGPLFFEQKTSCHGTSAGPESSIRGISPEIGTIHKLQYKSFMMFYVCMYVCMYGWMDVCMYVCMYGCMDGCMYVCMYIYIYE